MSDKELLDLANEVENLCAFLLLVEDTPGALAILDERGFSEDDFRHLRFLAFKLVNSLSPKRLAS
jgi:hypothetical protein